MNPVVKSNGKMIAIKRLDVYDARNVIGTPFPVLLHDAVDQKYDISSGKVLSHLIPNVSGLISTVAVMRACKPQKLSGKEIKFLRKSLSRKAKDFAEEIGLSAEQLSRYENDKQPISQMYERFLRAAVCLGHLDTAYQMKVDTKNVLGMQIISAHSLDKSCAMNLYLVDDPKAPSGMPAQGGAHENASWKRTG